MKEAKHKQLRKGLNLSTEEKIVTDTLVLFLLDTGSKDAKTFLEPMVSFSEGYAEIEEEKFVTLVNMSILYAGQLLNDTLEDAPDDEQAWHTINVLDSINVEKIVRKATQDFAEFIRRLLEWVWSGME